MILSSISQVGPLKAKKSLADHFQSLIANRDSLAISAAEIESVKQQLDDAEICTIDSGFADEAGELIKKVRKDGDSLGAAEEDSFMAKDIQCPLRTSSLAQPR